jgi:hypothetical protein
MTAKYRVMVCEPEEKPALAPLCFSGTVGYRIAEKFIKDTRAGRSEDECLAEIKAEIENSFNEGWAFIEKTIRDMGP